MRLIRSGSQPLFAIGFVFGIITVEPDHFAITFECQDVCGDAIEKPAIVGNYDNAAGEVFQRFLERAQSIHIQIIGRLIEQQHIGALLEHLGEMNAIALAAGKLPTFFC